MEDAEMNRLKRLMLAWVAVLSLAAFAWAQQQDQTRPAANPLVRLLQSKGIISEAEAARINQAASPAEAERNLASLLLAKGVISQQEYEQTAAAQVAGGAAALPVSESSSSQARLVPAVLTVPVSGPAATAPAAAPKPEAPKFIPALAPLRVLPVVVPKREGLIPEIKLGSGARLGLYGFLKASAVTQSATSGGAVFGANDFPLPLLLGDTGPNGDAQFNIKARAARAGVNFEWVDVGSTNLTLTGKLEFDFEGNFTSVNNRNISSLRSSQLSVRLAYMRLDSKLGGTLPWFAQFGQDWTILGSTTLPDYLETTGLGIDMGSFYERAPQFRTGVQFGKGDVKLQPEFAITLPVFSEPGLTVEERSRFGGRAGSDSNQPEVQGRLVLQFPLSHAPGVVPAQLIVSAGHSQRAEIVPAGSIPAVAVPALGGRTVRSFFPTGVQLSSDRNIWTAEAQLPTPWVTVVGKYFRGGDMRFYFADQLNDVFADFLGLPPSSLLATVPSFTNRSIFFLCQGTCTAASPGTAVVAPLRPVRGQGGFVQLGFPLSRIFGATPGGRNDGWSWYVGYGTDNVFSRDTQRPEANGLLRTDLFSTSLRYKLNKWVTFVHEVSYIDTRAASQLPAAGTPGLFPLQPVRKVFAGAPAHRKHAWRNEFGTIFTF